MFCAWVERERVTHSMNIGPALAQMLDYADAAHHDLSLGHPAHELQSLRSAGAAPESPLRQPLRDHRGRSHGVRRPTPRGRPATRRSGGRPIRISTRSVCWSRAPSARCPSGRRASSAFVGHRRPAAISACRRSTAPASPPTASSGRATSCTPGASAARLLHVRGPHQGQHRPRWEKFGAEEVENLIGRIPTWPT